MNDPQPQKPLEGKKKRKRKSKNTAKPDNNKISKDEIQKKKLDKKEKKKPKENTNNNKIIPTNDSHSGIFVFDEIANNKAASSLIYDLVSCYTCNCTLPKDEMDTLNKTLYEKTVSVFLFILNNCVDKIYNKLMKNSYLTHLGGKKAATKNAFCQTDISYDN